MKKLFFIIATIVATVSLTSCHYASADADEETVLVYKPWFFGHGGVDKDPVQTGSTVCVPSTHTYNFKIVPIVYTEEFDNMITADNNPVTFAVYLKLRIKKGTTPILYEKFGLDWYKNNVSPKFRTMVRDYASGYKMFDLASKREISAKLEKVLTTSTSDYINSLGLPVVVENVSIGAITPPQEVLNETKNTAAQLQAALTQNARANAELSRKQAEINKAIADKAYQNQMGMSVEQYLHLRQLEIEKEKVELIKDNKNVTIIFGTLPASFPVK